MATIFQIEDGEFGLALVDKNDVGYLDSWQAPTGKSVDQVTLADYDTGAASWSCQVTSGALNATPNVTTVEVPATFCEAASSVPSPGQTSFTIDVSFLQDPDVVAGLNRFLFENDTKECYFYLGLDDSNPPRVIGRCRAVSGTIGGAARTSLTADVSLPVSRKPDIEFGTATASIVIPGDGSAPVTPAVATASKSPSKATASAGV